MARDRVWAPDWNTLETRTAIMRDPARTTARYAMIEVVTRQLPHEWQPVPNDEPGSLTTDLEITVLINGVDVLAQFLIPIPRML